MFVERVEESFVHCVLHTDGKQREPDTLGFFIFNFLKLVLVWKCQKWLAVTCLCFTVLTRMATFICELYF